VLLLLYSYPAVDVSCVHGGNEGSVPSVGRGRGKSL